jgi:phenylacetate-CoA ligase
MLATNFAENFIPKINDLLKFVLENEHSDFYRKKYEDQALFSITSYEDFQKIPFLTKDEILAFDVSGRTFFPAEDVKRYSYSSGTTGHPIPTIIPHGTYDYSVQKKDRFQDERFKRLGIKKVLVLLPATTNLFRQTLSLPDPPAMMLPGDIHNLKVSARVIHTLSINGIMTTPTALDFLIDELGAINFDFSSVRWISIGMEFCSTLQFKYFHTKFPKAFFHVSYGNSEIGGTRHYRCEHLAENGSPGIFHILPDSGLLEIVNELDQPVPFGQAGEIIYTDLKQKAFPFLRYKMRDMASFEKIDCPCGNKVVLNMHGRTDYDVLKLHGVTIIAELVSRAVEKIQDVAELRFQLHVHEKTTNGKPKIQLNLHLKLRPQLEQAKKDEILVEILREKISANLQLSSKKTLAELVSEGIFLPLQITFVPSWPQDAVKTKNIISHLE